ncbi:MAG: hypothetical protein MI919_01605, partial [Holophagales bacterium]|nr:hypothetical protein [Holophagales bacterium]
ALVTTAIKNRLANADGEQDPRQALMDLLQQQQVSPLVAEANLDNLSENARLRMQEAWVYLLDNLHALEGNDNGEELSLSEVETVVEAILLHHNMSPLAAVQIGGLATANAEAHHLGVLRSFEAVVAKEGSYEQGKAKATDSIFQLLDVGALRQVFDTASSENPTYDQVPGSSGDPASDMAAILVQFFRYVEAAFPRTYQELQPHSRTNLEYFIRTRLGLALDHNGLFTAMGDRQLELPDSGQSLLETYDLEYASKVPESKKRKHVDNLPYEPDSDQDSDSEAGTLRVPKRARTRSTQTRISSRTRSKTKAKSDSVEEGTADFVGERGNERSEKHSKRKKSSNRKKSNRKKPKRKKSSNRKSSKGRTTSKRKKSSKGRTTSKRKKSSKGRTTSKRKKSSKGRTTKKSKQKTRKKKRSTRSTEPGSSRKKKSKRKNQSRKRKRYSDDSEDWS